MSAAQTSKAPSKIPKIAIIGAGPGGCMLARLLHQSSIPSTIFESEPAPNYRSQGGSLDLRAQTGLRAVKKAGLWDEFQQHARYDGEALLICDKKLFPWVRRSGGSKDSKQALQQAPEIDRAVLRRILMESVPDEYVRWGRKLQRVEQQKQQRQQHQRGGAMTLHFADGSAESDFDLVVGADGAFSKTRNLLTATKPHYSGLAGFTLAIRDAATKYPDMSNFVNRGSVFAFSDQSSLNAQQVGDGSINVSSYGHYPEDFSSTCGFDISSADAVKAFLRKQFAGWDPKLLALLDAADGPVSWRNLYMFEPGFTWDHVPGITLLGDAAHLMTPFAGIGVNTALHDATLLADAIVAACSQTAEPASTSISSSPSPSPCHADLSILLDTATRSYEMQMFASSSAAARLTKGCMTDMFLTPGAPRTSIHTYVARHACAEFPAWAHPLVRWAAWAFYGVVKVIW